MFLTIFTPIYNRGRFVNRLFQTLENQKKINFEWIIINDGSTDNTDKIIKNHLQNRYPFSIRYLKTQNGGKQRAINTAVKMAKGRYFFILDSDDLLMPETTQIIEKWCKEISKLNNFSMYAGVSGTIITPNGKKLSGKEYDAKYIDLSNLERSKKNLLGDMAEVYKTAILKKYPFYVFKGENFITEESVWNKIAYDGYILRWHMYPIYIAEYLDDGLTKNAITRDMKNYQGLAYNTKLSLKVKRFKDRIIALNYYIYIGRRRKSTWKYIGKLINQPRYFLMIEYSLFNIAKKVKKLI